MTSIGLERKEVSENLYSPYSMSIFGFTLWVQMLYLATGSTFCAPATAMPPGTALPIQERTWAIIWSR